MPRFHEEFRPKTLDEVVGQGCIPLLQAYVEQPYSTCWLFEGPTGVGKTSAALAVAADLGCIDSLQTVPCSELGVEKAREYIRALSLTPWLGGDWNILLLEELENLSIQCQTFLKWALEADNLPRRAIVLATSNCTKRLSEAVVNRFNRLLFTADKDFARSGQLQLAMRWNQKFGDRPMPPGWQKWGFNANGEYSLRRAYDALELAALQERLLTPAELSLTY